MERGTEAVVDKEPRVKRSVTCSDHCSACHLHFSGVEAFDLHRVGSHQKGERSCLDPIDALDKKKNPLFTAKTETGRCTMRGKNITGVTVWQTARAAAKGPRPAIVPAARRVAPEATRALDPTLGLGEAA